MFSVNNILGGVVGDRFHSGVAYINPDPGDAKTYTASAYVKGDTGETIRYYIKRTGDSNNFAGSTAQYLTLNSEWQRIEATFDSLEANTQAQFFFGTNSQNPTTADSVKVWGMQIEEGNYATSYIPTYRTPQTRNRDNYFTDAQVGVAGGILHDLVPDLFTVFYEFEDYDVAQTGGLISFQLKGTNRTTFLYNTSVGYPANPEHHHPSRYYTSGTFEGGRHKVAVSFDGEQYKVYHNGTLVQTDTEVNTSFRGIGRITLNYGNKSTFYLNQLAVFPKVLSDEDAEDLTEL